MKRIILLAAACMFISFFHSSCRKKSNLDSLVPITVAPSPAASRTFYVATTGNDSYTLDQAKNTATPWKTIQKAVASISGGDTIVIAGGTYIGRVLIPANCNGTASKKTLIKSKDGETVIIDGLNTGVQWQGMFDLIGSSYITIKRISIQNCFWYGFNGENATNITFDSCSTFNTQASGIYVKTSSFITVTNNKIRKACQQPGPQGATGSQECITLAKTNNFLISKNEVWETTFSGQGGEGIDVKSNCFDGEISFNYVHDLFRLGIYSDAGSLENYNIRIYSNKVEKCGGGIVVAGELGGYCRDIYIYNNLVYANPSSALSIGSTGNGKFLNIFFVNNSLYNNATTGFAGDFGNYNTNPANSNIVVKNNIFYNKTTNYRFSIWHDLAAPHVVGNNLYFDFKPGISGGINNFTVANLTVADVQADPQYNNAAANDFSLKSTSPAINKGVVITLPSSTTLLFTTDITGKSRGTANWDMGAYEF